MYEQQRFGQKNGQGFYQYEKIKGNRKINDPRADELLATICPTKRTFTKEEIIARMMAPMINEVVRCLEEGIIQSPSDADIALVYGLGFPPFRGGVFCYLDTLGSQSYLKTTESLQHLSPLYHAPNGLKEKAATNARYYPQPPVVAIDVKKLREVNFMENVVIIDGIRTPMGRSKVGYFAILELKTFLHTS